MTSILTIYIPMKVQPKQSFQASSIRPFPNKGVAENADSLALFFREHVPETPWKGPLRLTIVYCYSWRKKDEAANQIRIGRKWKDTRPDHGNLTKQIEDVMESMGFFTNDSQIASSRVDKFWADKPGLWITLEKLDAAC